MKAWYRSKGVVGSLIGLLVGLMGLAGIDIDTVHVEQATDLITGECSHAITSALTIAGGAVSLWGRIKATHAIGWRKVR